MAWAEAAARKGRALVIAGPTGTGKSSLGIELALRLGGEVVSVDSIAVYRGFEIGTAMPTMGERRGVPHHLIGIRDPAGKYSAGEFFRDSIRLAREIKDRGRVPIFVGGTMMYFNVLVNGISSIPPVPEETHAEAVVLVRKEGAAAAHRRLSRIDPASASRLSPNDGQRIVRALEVHMGTGRTLSEWVAGGKVRAKFDLSCRYLVPGDRVSHSSLLRERFMGMIASGLVDEVKGIVAKYGPGIDPLRSVGYRQVTDHVLGRHTADEAADLGAIATRRLAKRQVTWVRKLAKKEGETIAV